MRKPLSNGPFIGYSGPTGVPYAATISSCFVGTLRFGERELGRVNLADARLRHSPNRIDDLSERNRRRRKRRTWHPLAIAPR